MKKLFAITALCLVSLGLSAQRIVIDNTKNGERTVLTSDKTLIGNFSGRISVSLAVRLSEKDSLMAILASCDKKSDHSIFQTGDKMMIKLEDDTVISLTNLYSDQYESETTTNVTQRMRTDLNYAYTYGPLTETIYVTPFTVTSMVPEYITNTTTTSYALYLVSLDEMLGIIEKGVSKLRIETDTEMFDLVNVGRAKRVFSKLFECLCEALEEEGTSVEDGF